MINNSLNIKHLLMIDKMILLAADSITYGRQYYLWPIVLLAADSITYGRQYYLRPTILHRSAYESNQRTIKEGFLVY